MRASLPTALIAILLVSDVAAARRRHRAAEFDVPTVTAGSEAATFPSEFGRDGVVDSPVVVVSTVTVVPVPVGTADGIIYPGPYSDSGAAYPTGHRHRNHTHHGHTKSSNINATSTSIPVFSLQATDSLPLPTVLPTSASTPVAPKSRFAQGTSALDVVAPSDASVPTPSSTEDASIPISFASGSASTVQSSNPAPVPTANVTTSNQIPFLRGVNLGGWLILEKWMNGDLFNGTFSSASDQFTFDSTAGAKEALQNHWDTFFTESDIQTIAATGINALRIPIGFWAYDNDNTPYIKGADAYLEKAIGWARNAGMKVWVDCHGSPGSQNGFDNSGQAGSVNWQIGDNMERSISVLKTMATKYGALEYADVVVGLELTNEPISWGNNQFSKTQSWTSEAYAAVKATSANPDLVIVMHDAFEGVTSWTAMGKTLINGGRKTFGVDTHMYQLFTDADNALTQSQHITKACGWGAELATAKAVMPTYVGEWSAATNICVNPDGSTTAGTSCSTNGCQCQSTDFSKWNTQMIEQVRRFTEAQLDTFEANASGYFIWSAKGPGGWGFLNGIGNGAIPNPVTSRKYPGQCGGGKRRAKRGSLGAEAEAF